MARFTARHTIASVILPAIVLAGSGCSKPEQEMSRIERGKYLVMVGGCNDCHTPKIWTPAGPVLDTTRLLSGHPAGSPLPPVPEGALTPEGWVAMTNPHFSAWAGPWGVSFAYNLTPDRETGIGNWPEEMFIQTLRTGKFMGASRNILPPMPWENLAGMPDEDLKAIFAYLKSIPAVRNPIPEPLPPPAH